MTINKTAVYLLTLFGTLGIVVMRTVQNLLMIEAGSGFFYEGYATVASGMLVFMLGIILAATIYGFVCRQVPKEAPQTNKVLGVVYGFLAAAVLYELFFTETSKNIPAWQIILHVVLGISTTIILLVHCFSAFQPVRLPTILDSVLVLFWTVKLIIIFSNYSSLAAITENVFELASLCGILIFVLQFAKLQSGATPGKTNRTFLGSAVLSFMLCASYSIPQILLYLTAHKALAHTNNVTFITGFAMTLFIGVYVYMCFRNENIIDKSELNIEE